MTGKLFRDQNEITSMRTIDFQEATWMQTRLLCEKAYLFTNAKTYVSSDSVLCVGKMGDDPIASWKKANSMVFGKQSLQRDESIRRNADGVRVENIPGNHSVRPSRKNLKNY